MEEKKADLKKIQLERDSLPIFAHRDQIVTMIKDHLVYSFFLWRKQNFELRKNSFA